MKRWAIVILWTGLNVELLLHNKHSIQHHRDLVVDFFSSEELNVCENIELILSSTIFIRITETHNLWLAELWVLTTLKKTSVCTMYHFRINILDEPKSLSAAPCKRLCGETGNCTCMQIQTVGMSIPGFVNLRRGYTRQLRCYKSATNRTVS